MVRGAVLFTNNRHPIREGEVALQGQALRCGVEPARKGGT
jgi:hypothetical protein